MSCQILLNGLLSADVRDAAEVKVEANDSVRLLEYDDRNAKYGSNSCSLFVFDSVPCFAQSLKSQFKSARPLIYLDSLF